MKNTNVILKTEKRVRITKKSIVSYLPTFLELLYQKDCPKKHEHYFYLVRKYTLIHLLHYYPQADKETLNQLIATTCWLLVEKPTTEQKILLLDSEVGPGAFIIKAIANPVKVELRALKIKTQVPFEGLEEWLKPSSIEKGYKEVLDKMQLDELIEVAHLSEKQVQAIENYYFNDQLDISSAMKKSRQRAINKIKKYL